MKGIRLVFIMILLPAIVVAEAHLEFTIHVNADGSPLSGYTATLMKAGKQIKNVPASAAGSVMLEIAYGGKYEIVLEKAGYVTTTIRLGADVPSSEKKFTLIYSTSLDMFAEKEGHEARLASAPVLEVAYIPSKKNFGLTRPYINSVKYVPTEKKEVVPEKKEEVVNKKEADPAEPKETEEEKAARMQSEEKSGAAARQIERSAALSEEGKDKEEDEQQENAGEEQMKMKREVSVKKESIGKAEEDNKNKAAAARKEKAHVQQRMNRALSEAVQKEKKKDNH